MTVTHAKASFMPLVSQPASSNSMNANVQQRVIKVFADILNRKESEIRLDASLHDDLQVSSLDQMTLYIALEDEFQRSMSQEEVAELTTIKAIIDFIDRKLQESSSA
jgi:acyl carrier protein